MPDAPIKRAPADKGRVDIRETWQLQWWAGELGVTTEQVRGAVKKVGVMLVDVRNYLHYSESARRHR